MKKIKETLKIEPIRGMQEPIIIDVDTVSKGKTVFMLSRHVPGSPNSASQGKVTMCRDALTELMAVIPQLLADYPVSEEIHVPVMQPERNSQPRLRRHNAYTRGQTVTMDIADEDDSF